jgi:hypothetical protein
MFALATKAWSSFLPPLQLIRDVMVQATSIGRLSRVFWTVEMETTEMCSARLRVVEAVDCSEVQRQCCPVN